MRKILGMILVLSIVLNVGSVLAGSKTNTGYCDSVQAQLDDIKTQHAQLTENVINMANNAEVVTAKPNFYMSGNLGMNFSSSTDLNDVFDVDNGWYGTIAIGDYVQKNIRLEAEYQYLDTDNKLKANSIMSNAYYDFTMLGAFVPYVTTGIGIGWFDYADSYIDEDNHSFVWKLGAGIDYAANEDWKVGIRYTYFEAVDTIDFDTNQLGMLVTYNF